MKRRVAGRIYVTPSEVKAAKMKVCRMLNRGEQPSITLLTICNARK